jgi:hypothetical protein
MADEKDVRTPERGKGSRVDDHRIQIAGVEYSIPTIAFGLMLVGILLPTAKFSLGLNDPSPTQLLIAICISLFSAVVFLWILDSTAVLRFRSEWVSKSIYGAAIVSVLGTSVAVYKDAFIERKYPYEGRWEIQIRTGEKLLANNELILMYSDSAETYWGYSDFRGGNQSPGALAKWIRVNDFDNKSGKLNLSYFDESGSEAIVTMTLTSTRGGKLFSGSQSATTKEEPESKMVITLGRPK